jgi:perosamine synthetase
VDVNGERKTIAVSSPEMSGNEGVYVADCVARGWLSYGPYAKRFEREFAAYCHTRHGIATSSGTTALHLVLAALGVRPGDEIIVPNITFVATANAVTYCGAKPVFVDVSPYTWNIDPDEVASAITARTRGIIPVHLLGLPADMDTLGLIATQSRLWIVEDAAQAIGAIYRRRQIGSIGTAATFSFYANKTITTGEGGIVVTDRDELRDRMWKLRGHAQRAPGEYFHTEVGFNYRMTDLQGAVGCAQMEAIERHTARRVALCGQYRQMASRLDVTIQHVPKDVTHGSWMFAVMVPRAEQRDRVRKALAADGIETRPMFHPLNRLPMYADARRLGVSENIAARGICLPTHAGVTEADAERIMSRLGTHLAE